MSHNLMAHHGLLQPWQKGTKLTLNIARPRELSRWSDVLRARLRLQSGILKTTFRKLDRCPISGEEVRQLLSWGPLERGNLNHLTTHVSVITAL
jgi:hypothetical protein